MDKNYPPSVPIKKLAAAGRLSTKQYAIPMEWSDLEVFDAMQQALAGHVSDIIRIQADSNGVVAVAFDSSETKAQLEQLLNSVNFYEHGWNRGGVQGGEPGASFTVTAAKRS